MDTPHIDHQPPVAATAADPVTPTHRGSDDSSHAPDVAASGTPVSMNGVAGTHRGNAAGWEDTSATGGTTPGSVAARGTVEGDTSAHLTTTPPLGPRSRPHTVSSPSYAVAAAARRAVEHTHSRSAPHGSRARAETVGVTASHGQAKVRTRRRARSIALDDPASGASIAPAIVRHHITPPPTPDRAHVFEKVKTCLGLDIGGTQAKLVLFFADSRGGVARHDPVKEFVQSNNRCVRAVSLRSGKHHVRASVRGH